MPEQYEVEKTVELGYDEKTEVENKEALFFYHSWIRSDFELMQLAHDILLGLSDYGLVDNYKHTNEYKDIVSLIKQQNRESGKVRINCPFTGKFNWISADDLPEIYNDLIWSLSEYITEAYGIEGYTCTFYEGNWGLLPNLDD